MGLGICLRHHRIMVERDRADSGPVLFFTGCWLKEIKAMNRFLSLIAGVSMTFVLAGCYESSSITSHEPGVYKGNKDPLLQASVDQRAETMKKRFELVQTDR